MTWIYTISMSFVIVLYRYLLDIVTFYGVSIQFLVDHTDVFYITLKVILSLSDRYKIFTSDGL